MSKEKEVRVSKLPKKELLEYNPSSSLKGKEAMEHLPPFSYCITLHASRQVKKKEARRIDKEVRGDKESL